MGTNKLDIPDLAKSLAPFATRKCGDAKVGDVLGTDRAMQASVKEGELAAIFGASVAASIHLLNSADDLDDDGMLGKSSTSPADSIDWQPQVPFVDGKAWLKYVLVANATAKVTRSIGSAGLDVSGDRSVRILSYKRHAPNENIRDAVVADLDALASPVTFESIAKLGDGEATALKVYGGMSGTLSLKWSDVLSTSMGTLAKAVGVADDAFKIELEAGASVRFSLSIRDDFTLCISRRAAGSPFVVALRKAVAHESRFGAKAGITVAFEDPGAIQEVLLKFVSGVLAVPEAALEAIDKAPTSADVPAKYRAIVDALAKRLGIDAVDPYKAIKSEIVRVTARLREAIETIAEARVSMGVEYEYLRMTDRVSLLEAYLSASALKSLHGSILRFDFASLLRAGLKGVEIRNFLHQQTTERIQAWGFSLGIGTWLASSRQERKSRFVERRYRSDGQDLWTHAYLGSSAYKARANTWNTTYGAELKADQTEGKPLSHITGRDFRCGLHLWWEESNLRLPTAVARVADDAVLWGVVDEEGRADFEGMLTEALTGAPTCVVRFDATMGDAALRSALRALRDTEPSTWAIHAARALPWWHVAGRDSAAMRQRMYVRFFERYATSANVTVPSLRALVKQTVDDRNLARDDADDRQPWALINLLQTSDVPATPFWSRWRDVRKGANDLLDLLEVRGDWRRIDAPFRSMREAVLEQTYLIRIVADRLAEHGRDVANAGLSPSCGVSIKRGDQTGKMIVIGKTK